MGSIFLRFSGWTISTKPPSSSFIAIVYPHTSNWDFFILLSGIFKLQLIPRARWGGKKSIFIWPFGPLLRALGGIPINRTSSNQAVAEIVTSLSNDKDDIIFGLSPEGTRQKKEHIKSGFYYIAQQANLPVLPIALDYKTKTVKVGELHYLSGKIEKDLADLYNFLESAEGKHHEDRSPFTFAS